MNASTHGAAASLRVGLYARVSTERQAQDHTIASQIEALRSRIAADGAKLLDEHCFIDDGQSAFTLMRPALERLRDLCARRGLDRLYILAPDRLSRRHGHLLLLMEEWSQAQVEVVFLNRQLGGTPEDELLLQIQGVVAEYERAKMLERCRRGRRFCAQRGQVSVLAAVPYGYRYVSKLEGGGTARVEVVLDQARIVQQIFDWVARDRLSLRQICRRLAERNVPSATGRPYWNRVTIYHMLKNPAYKGLAAWGKSREGPPRSRLRPVLHGHEHRPSSTYAVPPEEWILIPIPAIVSDASWSAAAEQMAANRLRDSDTSRADTAICCLDCWCVSSAAMPGVDGARTDITTTAAAAHPHFVVMDTSVTGVAECDAIGRTPPCGLTSVRCCGNHSESSVNTSAGWRTPRRLRRLRRRP